MTEYESWVVGGKTVPHVREATKNPTDGTITLSCSALNWNIATGDSDVRDEIAYFEAMTSQYINNNPLLNGGTNLQIGNGEIITVTDGKDTWTNCALQRIEIKEDQASKKRIDYDLVIYYETEGSGGSYIYLADNGYRGDFTNIVCYQASTKAGSPCAACTNFGWLEITEPTSNVRRVEIYGSAYKSYNASLAWIEVNGDRQYWAYNADGDLPVGFEKLVWDITPTKTVTLQTSNHVSPFTSTNGLGCWLQWIKVIYE